MKVKLPIYQQGGVLTHTYLVEQQTIEAESAVHISSHLAHHVILIDRSSSMKALMPELQHRLHKLLILEEYQDAQVLVSLISYASKGDLSIHCERTTLKELMAHDDPRLSLLKETVSEGKTCISQALELALTLCKSNELTAFSLHSDGFANDPRYTQERDALLSLAQACRKGHFEITLNTIAHSIQSDFILLSELARLGGGQCFIAKDVKEVFEGIHHTTELLAQPNANPYQIKHQGPWVLLSRSDRLFRSGIEPQEVHGFRASTHRVLTTYKDLTNTDESTDSLPMIDPMSSKGRELCVALSRAALSFGDLNLSKWALLSSGSAPLIQQHLHATSAYELGLMGHELEEALFGFELPSHQTLDIRALPQQPSVIEILSVIHEHRAHVRIDFEYLRSVYLGYRSVKDPADTHLTKERLEPPYRTQRILTADVFWHALRFNHQTATLNLTVRYPVELINEREEKIEEIEGISLRQLHSFKSYSFMINGELTLPSIRLHIESKALFRALESLGILQGPYDPTTPYLISLKGLPILSENALYKLGKLRSNYQNRNEILDGIFNQIALARFMKSICRAILAGHSARFTDTQLATLKRIGLTPGLHPHQGFTVKETTKSSDSSSRLRPHYVVDLGEGTLASLARLPSANHFFNQQYQVYENDQLKDKAQLQDLLKGLRIIEKEGTKDHAKRSLFKPIIDGLLGHSEGLKKLKETCELLNVHQNDTEQLLEHCEQGQWSESESFELFSKLKEHFEEKSEQLYLDHLSPIVMMIGSLGLIPSTLQAQLVRPSIMKENRPGLKFTEREEAGLCLVVGEQAFFTITVEERA